MKEQKKTKAQLTSELAELHLRLAQLEKERFEAEQACEENQELSRTLADNSLDAILVYSLNGDLLAANAQAAKVYGSSSVEGLLAEVESVFDFLDEEGKARATARFGSILAAGSSEKHPYTVRIHGGKRIPVEVSSSVLKNTAGDPKAFISVIRDMTERNGLELKHRELFQRLSRSERMYRRIIDSTPAGVYQTNLEGQIWFVNQALADMLEYGSFEEMKQVHASVLYRHKEDRDAFIGNLRRQGLLTSYDVDLISRTGGVRHVLLSAVLDEDSIWGTVVDITERQRAEEALRESEERYRSIYENAVEGIFQSSPEGHFIGVNPASARICGYTSPEEMLADITDIATQHYVNPEKREIFRRLLEENGRVVNFEHQIRRKDGGTVWVSVNARAVYGEDGKIIYYEGTHEDIDQRKKAQETLMEREDLFRFIAENMGDIVWTLDVNLATTYVSPSIERVLGFTQEERKKQPVETMMTPDSLAKARDLLMLELQRDQEDGVDPARSVTVEIEYFHKDGSTVWLENDMKAMRNARGEFIGLYGVSRNITERKQAEVKRKELEERLQRAEKMEALGALAGGVAHDLNNVLGVLVGYSELLLLKTDEANPMRRYIANIMNSSERAAAIVQDLLTMARRGVHTEKVVNLNDIITDYQKTPEFEKLCSFHPGVRIENHLVTDLWNIMGSPVHLAKSVMNLVSNAAEAMPDGGLLVITTENRYVDKPPQGFDDLREGRYVVLSLADTGEGISPDDMKHIFEPFYTKKIMGRSGTGLGLSVVWGTVKDYNGSINVQSEKGKGSTFTLYFPAADEDSSPKRILRPTVEYSGRGETLLVVDDVEGQRELAAQMLGELNYRVATVSSGEQALAYLKDHTADLIVLDMIMDPGMDGLDTYRRILENRPRQKAILVSGYSETTRVRQALAIGAGAYVRKPYVLESIGVAVRKELDRTS